MGFTSNGMEGNEVNNAQKAIRVLSQHQDVSAFSLETFWTKVVDSSYPGMNVSELKDFFRYLLEQNNVSESMVRQTLDFYGNDYHHLNVRFTSNPTLKTAVDGKNTAYSKWIVANVESLTPEQLSYAAQHGDRYLKTLLVQSYKISAETVEEVVYSGIDNPKYLDSALVRLAVENPVSSTELVERLWKDKESNRKENKDWGKVEHLEEAFAGQGNTPVYILERCYVKGEYMAQLALIWNPQLPNHIAKQILNGDDEITPGETFVDRIISVVGVAAVIAEAENTANPWHEQYQSFLVNPDNFRVAEVIRHFKEKRDIDLSTVPDEWVARTIGWKEDSHG
jgi:hypothetical protein